MVNRIIIVVCIVLLLCGCSPNQNSKELAADSNTPINIPAQANNSTNNEKEPNINTGTDILEVPSAGKNLESFVPNGWKIKSFAEGDLNKDSLSDIVAVIEKQEDKDSVYPRLLLVLFKSRDDSYILSIKTEAAIKRANEGGVLGDPLESIKVDRDSMLLSFFGGAGWKWYEQYRFRFQDNGWYLIGVTLGSYHSGATTRENADEEDYNLLTGDYIFKKADEKGDLVTIKGNRGKRKLVNLNEFVVNSEEKQF